MERRKQDKKEPKRIELRRHHHESKKRQTRRREDDSESSHESKKRNDRCHRCDLTCCRGLADAYGAYFEAAGSLYQEKLALIGDGPTNSLDIILEIFVELVDYFACNVRETLDYLTNNCQNSCCGEIALAVAKISVGALESTLSALLIEGSITDILDKFRVPEINNRLQQYAVTVQQLVRSLCKDDAYTPKLPPVIIVPQ